MYRTIIICHDLHDCGSDALALGRLVTAASGGELIVAGLLPGGKLVRVGSESARRKAEQDVTAQLQAIAAEVGAEARVLTGSSLPGGLQQLATERNADLIVFGSSHRSKVHHMLARSVGLRLLRGSPCPVAIAPPGYRYHPPRAFEKVIVGFDGSYESGLALLAAVGLARTTGADVQLVTVIATPSLSGGERGDVEAGSRGADPTEELQGELDEAVAWISVEVSAEGTLLRGDPAQRLAGAASGEEVLIIGSRRHGRLRRLLQGSVSSALVEAARCPLFVHPSYRRPNVRAALPGWDVAACPSRLAMSLRRG